MPNLRRQTWRLAEANVPTRADERADSRASGLFADANPELPYFWPVD
jgi:hypothetical protein